MKKILYSLVFLIVFLSSCRKTEEVIALEGFPVDSVITPSVLANCIAEIFLIEAAVFKAQHDGKNVHDYAHFYYRNFFNSHHITKRQISKSIEYYVAKKQIEPILQNVVSRLTELDLKTPSVPAKDSIQPAGQSKSWINTVLNPEIPEN